MICALYRHFDKDGVLLYVGISLSAVARLSQHKDSAWFKEIKKVEIEHYPTRGEALGMEALAIRNENPKYNKVRRPDISKTIERLRQTLFHDKDVMDICDFSEKLLAISPAEVLEIRNARKTRAEIQRAYRLRKKAEAK